MVLADPTQTDVLALDLKPRRFGAFWMGGALSAMEQACLASFVAQGQDVTLFAYDEIGNVPPGIRLEDAAQIADRAKAVSFIYNGKPDLSHFSDYFRYKMFEKAGLTWIDTDIVLIDGGQIDPGQAGLIGCEKQGSYNGAVLYISDPDLQALFVAEVERLEGEDLSWGQTGPLLLNRHGARLAATASVHGYEKLYPIDHDDIWKALLPEHRAWCEAQCRSAGTLHLFNNVVVRMGYWKSIAPPAGSYLHACFQRSDALRFFDGTYPETVMRHLVGNFVASQTGERLGLKGVVNQALPSIARSYAHHAKALGAKAKPPRG